MSSKVKNTAGVLLAILAFVILLAAWLGFQNFFTVGNNYGKNWATSSASTEMNTIEKRLPIKWMPAIEGDVTLTEERWLAWEKPVGRCIVASPPGGVEPKDEYGNFFLRSQNGKKKVHIHVLKVGQTWEGFTC